MLTLLRFVGREKQRPCVSTQRNWKVKMLGAQSTVVRWLLDMCKFVCVRMMFLWIDGFDRGLTGWRFRCQDHLWSGTSQIKGEWCCQGKIWRIASGQNRHGHAGNRYFAIGYRKVIAIFGWMSALPFEAFFFSCRYRMRSQGCNFAARTKGQPWPEIDDASNTHFRSPDELVYLDILSPVWLCTHHEMTTGDKCNSRTAVMWVCGVGHLIKDVSWGYGDRDRQNFHRNRLKLKNCFETERTCKQGEGTNMEINIGDRVKNLDKKEQAASNKWLWMVRLLLKQFYPSS